MDEDVGAGSNGNGSGTGGGGDAFVPGARVLPGWGTGTGAGTGSGGGRGGAAAGGSGAGGAKGKLPQALQKSFGEVQGILEHNRVLIQEISQNQETRDADGLSRNVALIRELNTNIARVVDLYGDLSGSFHRSIAAKKAANAAAKDAAKRPRSAEQ